MGSYDWFLTDHLRSQSQIDEYCNGILKKSDKPGSEPRSKVYGELRDMIKNKKSAEGHTHGRNCCYLGHEAHEIVKHALRMSTPALNA